MVEVIFDAPVWLLVLVVLAVCVCGLLVAGLCRTMPHDRERSVR